MGFRPRIRSEVAPALHDAEVESAPQDPQGNPDPARGIRQFIVGTGGRNVYEPGTPLERNSEVHDGKTFGAIQMTLHAQGYDWHFVPVPGKTFTDTGSQACH